MHFGIASSCSIVRGQGFDEASIDAALADASFRGLIERFPDAVVVIHRDLSILYANHAAGALFGFAKSGDLLGRAVPRLFHAGDDEKVTEHLIGILATGLASTWEERCANRRDGRRAPVEVSGSRVVFGGRPAVLAVLRYARPRDRAIDA